MAKDGRQLQAGDPQWPEPIRLEGDPQEAEEDHQIDRGDRTFQPRKALMHGGQSERGRHDARDENDPDPPFVAPATLEGVEGDADEENSKQVRGHLSSVGH